MITEGMTLGVTFGAIKTDAKHKDQNEGSTTKATSYIVSTYGTYNITKDFFMRGLATIGSSNIKNKVLRTESNNTAVASSTYDMMSWGSKLFMGYNYSITDTTVLTPRFGLEFNHFGEIDYKETGTDSQNLHVKRKAFNKLEATLGAKLQKNWLLSSNLILKPSIHGNVKYGLLNKDMDVSIMLNNSDTRSLVPHTPKRSSILYNAGVVMKASKDNGWQYSAYYDIDLADKYIAHQLALKLKLKF